MSLPLWFSKLQSTQLVMVRVPDGGLLYMLNIYRRLLKGLANSERRS